MTIVDGRWLERTHDRDREAAATTPDAPPSEDWAAPLRRLAPAEDAELAAAHNVLVINKVGEEGLKKTGERGL